MVVPCIISIFAPSIFSLFVCFMFPEIEPAQSPSAQFNKPSQSLSKLSVHVDSVAVFATHLPETALLQTPAALSQELSSHCTSTPSPSASVPELDQEQLLEQV